MINFSHYSIIKMQKETKSLPAKIRSLVLVFLLRFSIVFLAMCMIVGCYSAYGGYMGIISKTPDVEGIFDDNKEYERYSSFLYYADGTKMDVEFSESGSNRIKANIDDIPLSVRNCFVAMEDERFYEHSGIDVRGIFRAAYSVLKEQSLDYGASTITQQLLKNQVFAGGKEKSPIDKVLRKVQEQYLAVKLETRLDKETILEYYLNSINLGNGAYGIEKAAQVYFGKSASDLTISEAAVLAPIAWSPTLANPLRDQEKNSQRRRDCLKNLYENGFCTKEEYEEALADTEDVYRRIQAKNQEVVESGNGIRSYFVDQVYREVLADLQGAGYSYDEAKYLIYNGGLQIYTTQDQGIQAIMDSYFLDENNFPNKLGAGAYYEFAKNDYAMSIVGTGGSSVNYSFYDVMRFYSDYKDTSKKYFHESGNTGIGPDTVDKDDLEAKIDAFIEAKKEAFRSAHPGEEFVVMESHRDYILSPQCAMVIMNPKTGEVVAEYGGRGEKKGNLVLDRATKAARQAGSTFKVLASFLPAIDAKGYTLADTFDDSYYEYPDSGKAVKNWYTDDFRGLQSIRLGISNSLNIVACRCLQAVGPSVAIDYLLKLGFKSIVTPEMNKSTNDSNVALALGGLTKGCSVLEMTAAYSAIANNGVYIEPRYYTYVLDHDNNILLDNEMHFTQVMKTSTAFLLTNAMVDTTTTGTGSACNLARTVKIVTAGKTGTAHNNVDLWFAGFTPYYCAAIWTGFDYNAYQTQATYHKTLWNNIMTDVHKLKGCEPKSYFDMPNSIVQASVCTKCGKLAVAGVCDKAEGFIAPGNKTSCSKTEYFAKGTVPTTYCDCHEKVVICNESGCLAADGCTDTSEIVVLIKEEDEVCASHGGTLDTPYILKPEQNVPCPLHPTANAGDDDPGNTPDDTPDED